MTLSAKFKSHQVRAKHLPALDLPRLPDGLQFQADPVADATFRVEARSDGVVIELFDVIGSDGVGPQAMADALRQTGPRAVTVRLNSPGGDYFDGVAIYNQLRQHQGKVTVQVLGIAASAASVVAMAGDRIEIARNAEIMIHNAWLLAIGNAEVMAKAAEILGQIDAALAETYAARSGQAVADVLEAMAAETFMRGERAVELGFADALLDQDALPRPQSRGRAPQTKRALEAELRRAGVGQAAAKRIVAGGWDALAGVDPRFAGAGDLAEQIRSAAASLQATRNRRTRW